MGCNFVGTPGTCPPTFLDVGGHNMPCSLTFFLRVCIRRDFKTNCEVCHVSCEEFFLLDVTHSHVDDRNRVWHGIADSDIFIIFTSNMICSILQVSRDRKKIVNCLCPTFIQCGSL